MLAVLDREVVCFPLVRPGQAVYHGHNGMIKLVDYMHDLHGDYQIDPSVFPDARVTSLWDGRAVSSQWFSQNVTHQPAPTWDYYLLFSSRARWGAVPGPVVSQGGPVVSQTGALLGAIQPLLR